MQRPRELRLYVQVVLLIILLGAGGGGRAQRARAAALPAGVDLVPQFRKLGLTPLAQGNRDVCSLFAITALAEYESGRRKAAPSGRLSEEFLIWAANKATGRAGDRAMFYEAVHGLETLAICQAVLMPYSTEVNNPHGPSAKSLENARSLAGHWRVQWVRRWNVARPLDGSELEGIKQALALGHPVACGLRKWVALAALSNRHRSTDPSPVRVIEQLLQARTERRREAGRPGRIDQADPDQIAQVSSVLVAPGDQFHPHERFELGDLKFDGSFRLFDFGQNVVVVPSNFLTGIEQMNSTAWFALRPVDERIDVEEFVINKPGRFKTDPCRGKVRTSDQDIDVARIADGVLVNPGDPLGDGVATDHRVRNSSRIERACGPAQSLFDLFRRPERPFPTDGADRCFCHDKRSL